MMTESKVPALWIRNYKSFGDDGAGFENIMPINVIIGRNNSGKSALIDLVQLSCSYSKISPRHNHKGSSASLTFTYKIGEADLRSTFQSNVSYDPDLGTGHYPFALSLIGMSIIAEQGEKSSSYKGLVGSSPFKQANTVPLENRFLGPIAQNASSVLRGKHFRRLAAERDIQPEGESGSVNISENGQGLTSAFAEIIKREKYNSDLIQKNLLNAINRIFKPDVVFTEISLQQMEDNRWELFLSEKGKNKIPLSNSGSGLKTIIMCAAYFEVIPHISGKALEDSVFAFEELENNLHPALQRRLLSYIRDKVEQFGCNVFISTHSSAAIDFFSKSEIAQIVHVSHNGEAAKAVIAKTHFDHAGIMDDLDIRASDLLQANGIVWVEGPTDRLYFNKWMELISDGQIEEGLHYQCVFYGGRLLAHLSGEIDGISEEDAVKILRVNRNAIVIIDSDKSDNTKSINDTKSRIRSEVEGQGGLAWITDGREIENYLSEALIKAAYPDVTTSLGQFESLEDYIEREASPQAAKSYARSKILFAEKVLPLMTASDLDVLDLTARLVDAAARVRAWNGLSVGDES